jgi:hypothetical protein
MKDDHTDQTNAYSEYFKAVKHFNEVNEEYITTVDQIGKNRKSAIQNAIEIQINPVISRTRAIQSWSGFAIFLSLIFLVIGINLGTQSTSGNQTIGSFAQVGLGTLLIFTSLGAAILSLIMAAWASSKISKLNMTVHQVQEKTNNPSVD